MRGTTRFEDTEMNGERGRGICVTFDYDRQLQNNKSIVIKSRIVYSNRTFALYSVSAKLELIQLNRNISKEGHIRKAISRIYRYKTYINSIRTCTYARSKGDMYTLIPIYLFLF